MPEHHSAGCKRCRRARYSHRRVATSPAIRRWPASFTGAARAAAVPVARRQGTENLPREGGYVLAANHISNFDPWPLGLPLFPQRLSALHGEVGALLVAARADPDHGRRRFPVRRGERDIEAIDDRRRARARGRGRGDVPGGHAPRERAASRGTRPRPHTGAARIALEAGVPLVPAAIAGTDRLTRLGPLRVRLRAARSPLDDLRDLDRREAARDRRPTG